MDIGDIYIFSARDVTVVTRPISNVGGFKY